MSTQKPFNRETHLKLTQSFWAKANEGKVNFDLKDNTGTYGKAIDFLPDYFYIKAITYISNNEQSRDENPVLVGNFADGNAFTVFGTFSPQGSIKQPNTYYEYTPADPNNPYIITVDIYLLEQQGVATPNVNQISKSTWLLTIEWCKYVDIV